MPSSVAGHSHRATTKTGHKPFKAGKNRHRKGKTEDERPRTPKQTVMSKLDRRNHNRQRQLEKQREHRLEASIFAGRDGAPRNVAVIPLCRDCDAAAAVRALNASLDVGLMGGEAQGGERKTETWAEADTNGPALFRFPVDRFKQQLQYIVVPGGDQRDVLASLDAARMADFVVFVLSATEEVDALGELVLRGVESQGLSTLFTAVQGLEALAAATSAKQRLGVVESLKSFMRHFHPDQDKLFSLGSRQECANLVRSLCSASPKGVHWRDERSWMLVEDVRLDGPAGTSAVLTGVVRGKNLKADRLVQVGDWGSFQVERITAAPLHRKAVAAAAESMAVDADGADATSPILDQPTDDRDDLATLAPEDAVLDDGMDEDDDDDVDVNGAAKGVLLDDHHYFSDEDDNLLKPAKKLPRGTSEYQASWILDDATSESEASDEEDDEGEGSGGGDARPAEPADGMEGLAEAEATEYAPTEFGADGTVAFQEQDDETEAQQLAAYRALKRTEAEDDLEFPDEIELPPNVLARERLARYRGLKSLRSSPWNEKADRPHEPENWRRLLRIPDYRASRIRAGREALVGGVAPGTRVAVHISVPEELREVVRNGVAAVVGSSSSSSLDGGATRLPLPLHSLLRHEHKHTAVHFLISLSADHPRPLKAKEPLIVQCGPRRMVVQPLYSQGGTTPNDVHKSCRFLHPGQTAVASFVGPVTWGSVPTLFFQGASGAGSGPLQLVGTGTALPSSTSRVVAKRVILTGHSYHIHKKVVTIRYMFFNRGDVEWFKALPLWTTRGRSGYIKESLGTHGYFKATFDGRINPQDSIGVSLYKRVWPRPALPFRAGETKAGEAEAMDEEMIG